MKLLFDNGFFSIHLFGLTIVLGMIVGFFVIINEGNRKELNKDKLMDLAMYTFIVGIIGARLNYIISFNFYYYIKNPKEILMINKGGMSIQGALILGVIFAFWYMKKKNMSLWKTADILALGMIIAQAIGRVGCDVFGIPMKQPFFWGIKINGELLHPVQLYESILNYLLFLVLWNKRKSIKYDGQIFFIYIIGFSANRFIVEFFRLNPIIIGRISIAHIFSIGIIISAIIAMKYRQKKYVFKHDEKTGNILDFKKSLKSIFIISLAIALSITFYYFIH